MHGFAQCGSSTMGVQLSGEEAKSDGGRKHRRWDYTWSLGKSSGDEGELTDVDSPFYHH